MHTCVYSADDIAVKNGSWFSIAKKVEQEVIRFDKPHGGVHVFRKKWDEFLYDFVNIQLTVF